MLLPYLRELTASQVERGLITYVLSPSLLLPFMCSVTHSRSVHRGEDDVRQFRELLEEKGMPVPVLQSTLAVPTESEVRLAAAGQK